MRVMIADDEVHICSLIKHLISWEALNLEFAGLFFNGKEVLDFLTHNVADILICDIEMPGMSGIELMENLSKIKPELQIIVISGFRNFEYAHTSMKYGVKYYLLKPVDEKELNEALEAIITSSKKEERIESTISITSVRLQLIDVLNGTQKMDELKSVNVKYHFEFQEGAFNVLQVILSGVNPNSDYMPLMMRMLADILRPKFLDFCYDVEFFCVNAVSMYIIINYSAENEKIIQTTLDCMLQDAIVELGCKTQSKCFIGVGLLVKHFAEITESYKAAKNIVCERLVNSDKRIYYAAFVNRKYFVPEDEYISHVEKRNLFRSIEGISLNETSLWVQRVFDENEKKILARPWLAFEYCSRIIELLLSILEEMEVTLLDKELFILQKKLVLYACTSIEEVKQTMADIMVNEIKDRLTEKLENVSAYAQQAKNYIDKNYNETVTLEKVAGALHINPTYLSIVFKNEMDINYSKYLTMVRMEKAKELLKRCDQNLTQIANAVGYDRTAYFSKIFQKYTGLKPSEYQRLYQHDIGN